MSAAVTTRVSGATTGSRVIELPRTNTLLSLHARMRCRDAARDDFVLAANRVCRLVLEEALGWLPHESVVVRTPLGRQFRGARRATAELYAVSVPRAGDAFEAELRRIEPAARIGKILIQRDTSTKLPRLIYSKLPRTIAGNSVLLMDPMMATAGTAKIAVQVMEQAGVVPANVVFANLLTCAHAIGALHRAYPQTTVITSFIDDGLTTAAFMTPGIGDFGDRFFGTDQ
jgi:uracil phosphoribosyltransferase